MVDATKTRTQTLGHLFLAKDDPIKPPSVNGNLYVLNGKLHEWSGQNVPVHAPIYYNGNKEQVVIGSQPMMGAEHALAAVDSASKAYNLGVGEWYVCSICVHCLYKLYPMY